LAPPGECDRTIVKMQAFMLSVVKPHRYVWRTMRPLSPMLPGLCIVFDGHIGEPYKNG